MSIIKHFQKISRKYHRKIETKTSFVTVTKIFFLAQALALDLNHHPSLCLILFSEIFWLRNRKLLVK